MKELLQGKNAWIWLVAGTCLLLLVPFIAMQSSSEVHWTGLDFIVMGTLLLSVGCLLIFLARKLSSRQFQVSATAVSLIFLYVWVELAVGVFFAFGS